MRKPFYYFVMTFALLTVALPASAVEPLIVGTWEITVEGAPLNSPTRFIMQVGNYNSAQERGNVDINQDDAFRSSGKGPYTRVGPNAWQFRDVQFHYSDQPPYEIIAKETHEFDLSLTSANTAESIHCARIFVEDLDGNLLSDICVDIVAERLPGADSF